MDKGFKLTQEQKLQQRLTPLQVRYVRMLEMNGPEFEEEVSKALDEMPALEARDPAEDAAPLQTTEDGERFDESAGEMQLADYRSEDDVPDYLRRHSRGNAAEEWTEPVIPSYGDTLIEYLMRQLAELDLTADGRLIAEYIIGDLDDNGYLTGTLQSIADNISINEGKDFSPELIREVFEQVRTLDPAGIAAVDLRDCLLLQLRRLPKSRPVEVATEIIRDYFDIFSKKHFKRIASHLGLDDATLADAISVISKLNPKPASLIESAGDRAEAVIPDFAVDVDPDDNITVTLLNKVPELQIEKTFAPDTPLPQSSEAASGAARRFLRQRRDEAADYIRIVALRQQTLFKVMSAIAKFQRPFFLTEDESQIRPMVLRELAQATGLNLSVVSRACRRKYVMTPHGIYPLKMFFNERRTKEESADSDELNTTPKIVAAIRSSIASEDKLHPLSDEQITRQLQAQGFNIARRTVAKYREKLGFPVGRLRKNLPQVPQIKPT